MKRKKQNGILHKFKDERLNFIFYLCRGIIGTLFILLTFFHEELFPFMNRIEEYLILNGWSPGFITYEIISILSIFILLLQEAFRLVLVLVDNYLGAKK